MQSAHAQGHYFLLGRLQDIATNQIHFAFYQFLDGFKKKQFKLSSTQKFSPLPLKIWQFIIYPENCSIQIALVKTFNRFPYCMVSRNVLSYCTGSKERRSRQDYFCQVVAMKEESGSHFSLLM